MILGFISNAEMMSRMAAALVITVGAGVFFGVGTAKRRPTFTWWWPTSPVWSGLLGALLALGVTESVTGPSIPAGLCIVATWYLLAVGGRFVYIHARGRAPSAH